MKPTKEQLKTALIKIITYQKKQSEAIFKSQEKDEEIKNKTPVFNNEQMKLHFHDICEAIELKFSQESISTDEDLIITFKNQFISIEPSLIKSALAYEELNKTYKLEGKAFIEEILSRFGDSYSHVSETLIIDFLNEIIKQKNLLNEKETFKRKIVWLKK